MFVGQMKRADARIGRQEQLVIPAAGADLHDDVVSLWLVDFMNAAVR